MNSISNRLRDAVAANGNISTRRLSEITGIPKSAIQRYISGETDRIPIDRIALLAGALGVTLDYMVGNEQVSSDRNSSESIYLINCIVAQLNHDNLNLAVEFLAMLLRNQ